MPESTRTITKHTTRVKHIHNISQVKAQLLLTTQPELIAPNTEKQQTQNETQRTIPHNATIQLKFNARKTKIILNNVTGTPTQNKHYETQQSDSAIRTQNTLNITPQKNVNTSETKRRVSSNEDEKITISAATESTSNQYGAIPMPYCKLPSDLG